MAHSKKDGQITDLAHIYGEIVCTIAKYYNPKYKDFPWGEKQKQSQIYNIITSVALIGNFDYFDKIYKDSEKGSMTRNEALAKSALYWDTLIKVDNYYDSKLFKHSPKLMKSFGHYAKYFERLPQTNSVSEQYDLCWAVAKDLKKKLLKASVDIDPVIETVWKIEELL